MENPHGESLWRIPVENPCGESLWRIPTAAVSEHVRPSGVGQRVERALRELTAAVPYG